MAGIVRLVGCASLSLSLSQTARFGTVGRGTTPFGEGGVAWPYNVRGA